MIWLLWAGIAAAAPQGLRNTAQTLDPGAVVVRLPTGRSAVGLAEGTELWLTPLDLVLGGTRVGVEQRLGEWGDLSWSLSPSVGQAWTWGRTSLRLESTLTLEQGRHRLSLLVAPDQRLMRRTTLSEERSAEWSLEAFHLPVALTHDLAMGPHSLLRSSGRLGVLDEGETLTWGTVDASWIQQWRGLHVQGGVGLFVGTPSEHGFLGSYERPIVSAWPKLDLWWMF